MTIWRIAVLTPLLTAVSVFANPLEFEGVARDKNGQPLYTEHHRMEGECREGLFLPRQHAVNYRQPDSDTAFADKQMTFNGSVFTPAVNFSQPKFDEQLTIEYPSQDQVAIEWVTGFEGQKKFTVERVENLVVDSGFDHFIHAKWQALIAGKKVKFRFLGPTRGEHYGFVAETVSDPDVDAHLVVRLRPASLFLRALMDPIVLGYNEQGALTDYLGVTNIRKDADNNHTAHIRYQVNQYPDCSLIR